MATSANATYSAAQVGGVYNYEVRLTNTSPASFDVYSFLFGTGYNVPLTTPFPLQDIVFIGAPPGWTGFFETYNINWFTSFQGSSSASGYLAPGQTGAFMFQSSTAPPESLPFGCCFYNNANEWGFCANGTAVHRARPDRFWYFAEINPLVLVIGDEMFARLNLPRPPTVERDLRARLAADIQAMTPRQRETAAEAVDGYVAALTDVSAALKEAS
jgi:hypothetical protein